jgi:tetratricopeptide (TPR) repeat protein
VYSILTIISDRFDLSLPIILSLNPMSKRCLVAFTFLFVNAMSFAQHQQELDSLSAIFSTAKDTTEVRTLYNIARLQFDRDPALAFVMTRESLNRARQLDYIEGMVHGYNLMGAFYNLFHNDFDTSKLYLDSAEAVAETRGSKISVFTTQAMWHSRKGEFDKSHAYLIRALELLGSEKSADAHRIYSNLGYNLAQLGRNREGVQFYKKAAAIAEETNDHRNLGAALSNMGIPYMQLNEFDSALLVYERLYSLELKHGNPLLNPTLLSELGKLYFEKGKPDTAYYFMHTGLRAACTLNIPYAVTRSLSNLGRYHLKARPDSALFYGRKLYRQINNTSALSLEDATYILAQAHGKLRRYDSAFIYHNEFLLYHDSVFQDKQTKQIAELEALFDLKRKQEEISRLSAERQNEILKRNTLAGGLMLWTIIGVLVYFFLRGRIRTRKKELEAKNWQLENYTRKMIEKTELVEELRAQLEHFKAEVVIPKERIENVAQILNTSILTESDWEEFKLLFEQVHRNFFAELKIKYPGLTQAEIRLAALVKLNLNTREMANMLGISVDSANKARYRLRKKLELQPEQDLNDIIAHVSNQPNQG